MLSPETIKVLYEALGIMGKGMLGIFTVISLIAVIVYFLTKITNRPNKNSK